MIKKLLGAAILAASLISTPSLAATSADAERVYKQLAKGNGWWVYPPLKIVDTGKSNAWTYYTHIDIDVKMLASIRNDDQLAFILGHELGHWRGNMFTSTYKAEYASDRLGVKYSNKAGFNGCRGAQIMKKWKGDATTHPSGISRLSNLGC